MRPEIVETLSRILRIEPADIDSDTSPDSVGSWDSLAHLEIVQALESRTGVRFSLREIQSMDSAGRIERVLAARAGTT